MIFDINLNRTCILERLKLPVKVQIELTYKLHYRVIDYYNPIRSTHIFFCTYIHMYDLNIPHRSILFNDKDQLF